MGKPFLETAKACLTNGERLLFDAEMLSDSPSALALTIIAEEEFAKGFLLVLVDSGAIPWNEAMLGVTRDHKRKQLLTILMDYANPDSDEIWARIERRDNRHTEQMRLYDQLISSYKESTTPYEHLKTLLSIAGILDVAKRTALHEHQQQLQSEINRLNQEISDEDAFPPHVADAINILWSREEKEDRRAQAIVGARDRKKQDAIYVRIDKTGRAINMPRTIDEGVLKRAKEHAKKLQSCLSSVLEHTDFQSRELEELSEALKIMFAGA